MARSPTNEYVSAASLEGMDAGARADALGCGICLGPLRAAVALVPCGHSFCARCLGRHLGRTLEAGLPLGCPLRCAAPTAVVRNSAARAHEGPDAAGPPADDDEADHPCLALPDASLPLDVRRLKARQAELALARLQRAAADGDAALRRPRSSGSGPALGEPATTLQTLARLAWSDDEVRRLVTESEALLALVAALRRNADDEGVQCAGALALMALVRGDGEVCRSAQWRIAKAGGVEALVGGMRALPDRRNALLSVLLCLVALALENVMMQAHLSQVALDTVVVALREHAGDAQVQAKGLVLLGVMAQGEDVTHDAIRQQVVEAGAADCVAGALSRHGGHDEEVLWAALFAAAVLLSESAAASWSGGATAAAAGLPTLIESAIREYVSAAPHGVPDDVILGAAGFLLSVLRPLRTQLWIERALVWSSIAGFAVIGATLAARMWASRRT